MRLSSDPVASGGIESGPRGIGEVGKLPVTGGITGYVAGMYPVVSGETWYTGNTSTVSHV